jgi:hypothetical protein
MYKPQIQPNMVYSLAPIFSAQVLTQHRCGAASVLSCSLLATRCLGAVVVDGWCHTAISR